MDDYKSLKTHRGAENPKAHPWARLGLVSPWHCPGSRNSLISLGFPAFCCLQPSWNWQNHILGSSSLFLFHFFFIFLMKKKKKKPKTESTQCPLPSLPISSFPSAPLALSSNSWRQKQGNLQRRISREQGNFHQFPPISTNFHLPNFGGALETARCLLQSCLAAPPPRLSCGSWRQPAD